MAFRIGARGGLVGAVALLSYLLTLPLTLTEGDSAEWLVIALHGGIPHPSGYPLFAMVCQLAVRVLFFLPAVTAVAVTSGVFVAAALAFMYRALRAMGFTEGVAAVATLTVGWSYPVWRIATMVEPFALNLLLAAVVLWLGTGGLLDSRWRYGLLGLVFGFGVSNHHSLVMLVPVGTYALFHAARGDALTRIGQFAVGFASGLLPFLYLLVARTHDSPYDFYEVNSLKQFFRLLLRMDYGTLQLAKTQTAANWGSFVYFVEHLPQWLTYDLVIPLVVGLVLAMARIVKRRGGLEAVWMVSLVLAGVVFLRLFNVAVVGWIGSIIERFMALPVLLLAWPVALGLQGLAARVPLPAARWVGAVVVLVHLAAQGVAANRLDDDFYERHCLAVAALAAQSGGVLVTTSDAEALGAMHVHHVLGTVPDDFISINAAHWGSTRFRRNTARRFGLPDEFSEPGMDPMVRRFLALRGYVAVADMPLPPLPAVFRHSFPLGPISVLVESGRPLPDPATVWAMNREFYAQAGLERYDAEDLTPWNRDLLEKYRVNLRTLIDLFEKAGLAMEAAEAKATLGALSP